MKRLAARVDGIFIRDPEERCNLDAGGLHPCFLAGVSCLSGREHTMSLNSSGKRVRRNMATARVIKFGKGQAVVLPKEFRVNCKELEIWRNGDEIVLREKGRGLERVVHLLASLPNDVFPDGRKDDPPQRRKGL